MIYADYNNTDKLDDITIKLQNEYLNKMKNIKNNDNVNPMYNNYYYPQAGFCNMSFGGLIKESKTSTIVIPINADLEYDSDCKMGYNTTLLVPITVPEITPNNSVVIVPIVTQQKIDNENKNIITTSTQQPLLEAKVENDNISVKPLNNISDISNNIKVITSVTNLDENPQKLNATTIVSLPIQPNENKKVTTDTSVVNTDISGSNIKTDTNINISQTCLNGTIQCDVKQKINSVKSETNDNYATYSQSTRTVLDLSSGQISVYGKNESSNINTVPTNFIDNKTNDISENKINLVNNDNSLKYEIPVDVPTIVKIDENNQVVNTTTEPIKINTKEPFIVTTMINRFNINNIEGFSVSPIFENFITGSKEILPKVNIPVFINHI
jgi:hypothetical protein